MDGSRLTKGLLAALESMRGGARMRPDGAWPSERLLNDTLPKVGARCSLGGDVGEKERAGLGGVGGPRSSEVVAGLFDGAHTWSASCNMSMSTPHDEHLIIGKPLILSIFGDASSPVK